MKCRYCNNSLGNGAKFCNQCGREVEELTETADDILKQLDDEAEKLNVEDENETIILTAEKETESSENHDSETVTHRVSDEDSAKSETEVWNVGETVFKDLNDNDNIEEEFPVLPEDEKSPDSGQPGKGRIVGAVFASVPAFILILFLSLACCLKIGVAGNTISNRVNDINMIQFVDSCIGGETVSDRIYDALELDTVTGGFADKSDFREFLLNSDFKTFLRLKTSAYSGFMINGKGSEPSVTTNDIVDFFKTNSKSAQKCFGMHFRKTECNALRRRLEKKDIPDSLLISSWSSKLGFNLSVIRYAFQIITLAIAAAMTVLIFIGIGSILQKRKPLVLGFIGNILFYCGILVFLTGAAVILGSSAAYTFTGSFAFFVCSDLLLPFALFAVSTGAFEFFIGLILRETSKFLKLKK